MRSPRIHGCPERSPGSTVIRAFIIREYHPLDD
jgi:hypothetical protein